MAAAVARSFSRHGAVAASVLFHGAVLALLILKLTPPILSAPANAEIPAIAVEVITLATPAPPPPPPEPVVIDEPPPLIESTVAETVIEPPPPPKVEKRKPEPKPESKPRPKPKPVKTPPKPVEQPPERVATTAIETPAPAPAAQQTAAVPTVGRAGPPPNYLSLLHSALERNKDYPRAARQKRQQGRAMLRFAIDRSGKVLDYKIEKSTGYDTLDREVVAMIQRASPLPPMPAEMTGERLEVVVPVPFTLH